MSYPEETHKATCADCGKECEVPFKPDEAGQFIAVSVMQNEDHQEDIKLLS